MNNPQVNFPPSLLENITGGTLFYPCAGADFEVPVTTFAATISEFIFVDRGYFAPGHQDPCFTKMDGQADFQEAKWQDRGVFLQGRQHGRRWQR